MRSSSSSSAASSSFDGLPRESSSPSPWFAVVKAQEDAKAYWNKQPCNGVLWVQLKYNLGSQTGNETAMVATWDDFLASTPDNSEGEDVQGPKVHSSDFRYCTLELNTAYFLRRKGFLADWPEFCTMMVQEYEYYTNQWQVEQKTVSPSASPKSIAYPTYTDENEPVLCSHAPPGANRTFDAPPP